MKIRGYSIGFIAGCAFIAGVNGLTRYFHPNSPELAWQHDWRGLSISVAVLAFYAVIQYNRSEDE